MKLKQLLILGMAAFAITACSKDNDGLNGGDGGATGGEDGYAAFTITVPQASAAGTRATENGVTAENNVNTMDVFVFDATPPYSMTHATFTKDVDLEETSPGSGVFRNTKAVKTKKTDKNVIVGLNLNSAIRSEIINNGYSAFKQHEFAETVANLASAANGFVMFSEEEKAVSSSELSPSEEVANQNRVSVKLDRVVAKAAVWTAQNYTENLGGKLINLQYGWKNANRKFYFVQQNNASGSVIDHNYETYSHPDDFVTTVDTYLDINSHDVAIPSVFAYVTENAFPYSSSTVTDEASFLSIRGEFIPASYIRNRPESRSATSNFITVDNSSETEAKTFYQLLDKESAKVYYFYDLSVANRFKDALIDDGATATNIVIDTYADGKCYWHAFVNTQRPVSSDKYNVLRNEYYKVKINKITNLGFPDDDFDTGEQIKDDAYISVSVTINPWEVVDEEIDLR